MLSSSISAAGGARPSSSFSRGSGTGLQTGGCCCCSNGTSTARCRACGRRVGGSRLVADSLYFCSCSNATRKVRYYLRCSRLCWSPSKISEKHRRSRRRDDDEGIAVLYGMQQIRSRESVPILSIAVARTKLFCASCFDAKWAAAKRPKKSRPLDKNRTPTNGRIAQHATATRVHG